jgi:hypothetical protein
MSNQVKYCQNCGAQIPANALFCTACGAKQGAEQQMPPPPPPAQYGAPQPSQYGAPPSAYYAPPPTKQNVSNLWYIAPVLFAILGGGVAWFLNKDKDPEKARNFLIVGAVMTVINLLLMYW